MDSLKAQFVQSRTFVASNRGGGITHQRWHRPTETNHVIIGAKANQLDAPPWTSGDDGAVKSEPIKPRNFAEVVAKKSTVTTLNRAHNNQKISDPTATSLNAV